MEKSCETCAFEYAPMNHPNCKKCTGLDLRGYAPDKTYTDADMEELYNLAEETYPPWLKGDYRGKDKQG
jgi:hypothetical protein